MPDEELREEFLRVRGDEIVSREIGEEAVLLDLRSSRYLSTNPAATVLWRLLQAGTTRSALAAALMDEFGIDQQRADDDVGAFLNECRRRGMLDGES